jgi:hypothetical protein
MKAVCKVDWGQFEINKKYYYSYEKNLRKYYVNGDYEKTEFTKKQFDVIFIAEKHESKIQNR